MYQMYNLIPSYTSLEKVYREWRKRDGQWKLIRLFKDGSTTVEAIVWKQDMWSGLVLPRSKAHIFADTLHECMKKVGKFLRDRDSYSPLEDTIS